MSAIEGVPEANTASPGARTDRALVAAALVAAGWGANQFTPLSVVYRLEAGWSTMSVVEVFTVYLAGLVPALLLGCRTADRFGHRRVVRIALAITAAGSLALALAEVSGEIVVASRLATGVAAGLIVSAGAAWLRALSPGADRGARFAVYATGAGFALGPLLAGTLAAWLPASSVVPCLVHGGFALLVLALTARIPEMCSIPGPPPAAPAGDRWSAITHPRFVGIVLPASPAIFAAVTVSYVVLPPFVLDRVRDHAPLFSGLVAAVTLLVGLAVQPLAAKIDRPGSARATLVAMGTVVIGLLLGALAIEEASPLLVLAAAVFLGAGYGLTLESGLAEIGRLAPPGALPTVSALFQGVAHSGFLAPLLLAVMARSATYPELLAGLALVGFILLMGAAVHAARHAHQDPHEPTPHTRS
ncbi:MFS transporter [Nocardioides sp. NPDC087217]|uniref:MFS transporter n=1 Tax=Nocardioides sp. NPDC087217 TaxID=3364335 RepID=UPI0038036AD4